MDSSSTRAAPPADDASGLDAVPATPEGAARFRRLVDGEFALVWRFLRGLGVAPGSVDDAAQQVFLVAAQRIDAITAGERAGVSLLDRARRRGERAPRADPEPRSARRRVLAEQPTSVPNPEQAAAAKQARALLEAFLEELPEDARDGVRTVRARGDDDGRDRRDARSPAGDGGLAPAPSARRVPCGGEAVPSSAGARAAMKSSRRRLVSGGDATTSRSSSWARGTRSSRATRRARKVLAMGHGRGSRARAAVVAKVGARRPAGRSRRRRGRDVGAWRSRSGWRSPSGSPWSGRPRGT